MCTDELNKVTTDLSSSRRDHEQDVDRLTSMREERDEQIRSLTDEHKRTQSMYSRELAEARGLLYNLRREVQNLKGNYVQLLLSHCWWLRARS